MISHIDPKQKKVFLGFTGLLEKFLVVPFLSLRSRIAWAIMPANEARVFKSYAQLASWFVNMFEQNEVTALLLSKLHEKTANALADIIIKNQVTEDEKKKYTIN